MRYEQQRFFKLEPEITALDPLLIHYNNKLIMNISTFDKKQT
jgi:hypothetical protein